EVGIGLPPAVELQDVDLEALVRRGFGLDAAELLVVDQPRLRGVLRADRAAGVLLELELAEAQPERVEQHQTADQRLADAHDQLDHLVRLERADDSGQHAEHTALRARGDETGGRRLGEEAAVAGSARAPEDRDLAFEAEDRAVDVRLAEQDAGVVDQIAGGEVVRAVDHQVVIAEEVERIARIEPQVVGDDLNVAVDAAQAVRSGLGLRPADVSLAEQDLALEVRLVHAVEIDEPEPADSRRREIEPERRAQAAAADQQHARRLELPLARGADLGQDEMAAVAAQLVRVEPGKRAPFDETLEAHRKPPAIEGMIESTSPSAI